MTTCGSAWIREFLNTDKADQADLGGSEKSYQAFFPIRYARTQGGEHFVSQVFSCVSRFSWLVSENCNHDATKSPLNLRPFLFRVLFRGGL